MTFEWSLCREHVFAAWTAHEFLGPYKSLTAHQIFVCFWSTKAPHVIEGLVYALRTRLQQLVFLYVASFWKESIIHLIIEYKKN